MTGNAAFSPCRQYRYALWRQWGPEPSYVLFVGLNPSTADESHDDPTVRRCIGFARRWGYDAVCIANLFAYRTSKPKLLNIQTDPVGPDNDAWLGWLGGGAELIVVSWGCRGDYRCRAARVTAGLLGTDIMCFGKTEAGFPQHPLYLRRDAELRPYYG